jgi:glutamyl-tRNA synthetase/glutamyl-Q tRNA(Asp) synthetase
VSPRSERRGAHPVDLAALAARLQAPPVTRFAPSPTGHLHLGHLVDAIFVWGIAGALGGRVQLRIENHDQSRARGEFETTIFDDLEWLGFVPDSPPIATFRAPGPCAGRQMDRPERYTDAMVRLTGDGLVYWCDCSRQRVLAESGTVEGELRYGGRCRTRGLGPGPARAARVRLPSGGEHFTDAQLGEFVQTPAEQCGDLLIQDRFGHWTYQFAVTVDDYVDGVTLVIRGEDLLPSSGRQISMARLLGRTSPPVFLHHPLVLGPSGTKLSKSNRDTGLGQLREAGVSPSEAIGRAAAAVGLIDHVRPVAASEVAEIFTT